MKATSSESIAMVSGHSITLTVENIAVSGIKTECKVEESSTTQMAS